MDKPKLSTIVTGLVAVAITYSVGLVVVTGANAAPKAAGFLPDGEYPLICTVQDGVLTGCRPPEVTPTPTPSATATTTPTATPTPSTPPSPTSPATPTSTPTPSPTPTTPPPSYPDATTTGVPAAVILTPYSGPCTIRAAGTIIEAKTINCTLSIRAANVVIRNSVINGAIENGSEGHPGWNFEVRDSDIIAPPNTTAIGESFFTVSGSDIRGGNRGVNCYSDCTISGNYIHGNRISGSAHASAVRAGMRTVVSGNTLTCDVANTTNGGGCSADLTMYPDFSPVTDVLVTGNKFLPTNGYFCAYGGATAGKPYSGDPTNATRIRFINNEFVRGPGGRCGEPRDGNAVTDYAAKRLGNFWSANRWDDGSVVPTP